MLHLAKHSQPHETVLLTVLVNNSASMQASHNNECLVFRPSDRRTSGKDPKVQCAFENQMFGVSCNSHRLTQLAAFFIDLRTE